MTDKLKQYELAWSEFIEWLKESEWYSFIYEMYSKNDPKYTPEKVLPMLLQVFVIYLRDKEIRAEALSEYVGGGCYTYAAFLDDSEVGGGFFTNENALLSACTKGFEIRNEQIKNEL